MLAAGLGRAFERDNLWDEYLLLAYGAIAIELSVGTNDSLGAAVADNKGIAASGARLGATVG